MEIRATAPTGAHLFMRGAAHSRAKETFDRLSLTSARWDVSGRCLSPKPMDVWARRFEDRPTRITRQLELHVRCRKCDECGKYRANFWAGRAVRECNRAHRTWFATLTLAPATLTRCTILAEQAASDPHMMLRENARDIYDPETGELLASGVRYQPRLSYWSTLTKDQKDARIAQQVHILVQKMLKRVRKQLPGKIRYLCVYERGDQHGRLHCHMLIHEELTAYHRFGAITESSVFRLLLREWNGDSWRHGITNFQVARSAAAGNYLCSRYIAKDAVCKIRASVGYGLEPDAVRGMQSKTPFTNPTKSIFNHSHTRCEESGVGVSSMTCENPNNVGRFIASNNVGGNNEISGSPLQERSGARDGTPRLSRDARLTAAAGRGIHTRSVKTDPARLPGARTIQTPSAASYLRSVAAGRAAFARWRSRHRVRAYYAGRVDPASFLPYRAPRNVRFSVWTRRYAQFLSWRGVLRFPDA